MALLATLAHDSLLGRRTGQPGATSTARIIAREMAAIGLVAGGDSGFLQRVPVGAVNRVFNNREVRGVPTLLASFAERDSLPVEQRLPAFNVIGVLQGADPALAGEYLLIGAHYDHIGVRGNGTADSIYNGADDDASGVVAVLEAARQLAAGPRPKRTVVFAAWTGEESGLIGARWFSKHPIRPLEQMAANLEIEMIGRPDSLAGGSGKVWLTGFARSSMGGLLKLAGLPVGPDRRPAQEFFRRSDNYQFALEGIVAHTISSYNMHSDYHQPTDEVSRIDAPHFAAVIEVVAQAVRVLADGPRPTWRPDGRPTRAEKP